MYHWSDKSKTDDTYTLMLICTYTGYYRVIKYIIVNTWIDWLAHLHTGTYEEAIKIHLALQQLFPKLVGLPNCTCSYII